MSRKILVTGGYGFIGSHFIKHWMEKYPEDTVTNLDGMTYAARPTFLNSWLNNGPRERLVKHIPVVGDIRDRAALKYFLENSRPDHVFHFAAESHVCRSIAGPEAFVTTNVVGTFNLLEEFKNLWKDQLDSHRFMHISTDEVFGELGPAGKFTEDTPLAPRSPYATSKASSDLLVQAYTRTYGLNSIITNCTNNFGPNQHPEKLIPRTITSALHRKPIIVHGQGDHVRDWIWVEDHCKALDVLFHQATGGEHWGQRFCVGADAEATNLSMIKTVLHCMKDIGLLKQDVMSYPLTFTDDRPTDDKRYAVDTRKLRSFGWKPWDGSTDALAIAHKLQETIRWYVGDAFT